MDLRNIRHPVEYLHQRLRLYIERRWSEDCRRLGNPPEQRFFAMRERRFITREIVRYVREHGLLNQLGREWYSFGPEYPSWGDVVLELCYQRGLMGVTQALYQFMGQPDGESEFLHLLLVELTRAPLKVVQVAPQVAQLLRQTRPPSRYELFEHCPRQVFVFPRGELGECLGKPSCQDILLAGRGEQAWAFVAFYDGLVQVAVLRGHQMEADDAQGDLARVGHLVGQLLLLMQEVPEFVSRPSRPRHRDLSERTWKLYGRVPYILSPGPVRAARLVSLPAGQPRRSPAPHWRRGHWARVWTGPRAGPRRVKHVWIPPVLVRGYALDDVGGSAHEG